MFNIYANGESIHFPVVEDLVIVKPKLTLEIGKSGSFEFSIPPTHQYYNSLQKLKTVITVDYDETEIFRGRVLTINKGFNNVKKVRCEGNLSYLVDSVQKGERFKGKVHDLFRQIIAKHNDRVESEKRFTVGEITVDNRDIVVTGSSTETESYETKKFKYEQIAIDSMVDDWSTTLDYIQETIINYCGGYLRTRRVGNTTYIDLLKDYFSTSPQHIEFGRNLIDFAEEVKSEDLYTVLIPLGEDNLTIKKVNGGSDELVDQAGVELYGRIVKTHVFDGVRKASTLLEDAQRMLANHENMPVTFTVKAVDMHLIDDSSGIIKVGDKVYVNSIPHGITDYLTCTKIEYDLENHSNDTYTFGNPKQSLTERYRKDKAKSTRARRSSGSRGSAGVAAAVEQDAEEFVEETVEKTERKIFDAYIDVDPDAGKITLGALHNLIINGKEYLKTKVGIDLDADKGTLDIYAMNRTLDNHGIVISENSAGINVLANDLASEINAHTEFKTKTTNSLTKITQRVTKNEASIEQITEFSSETSKGLASVKSWVDKNKASLISTVDFVDKRRKDINNIATIESVANANKASILLQTTYNKNNNDQIAEIKLNATRLGSQINLKADKTVIDSQLTKINGRLEAIEGKFKTIDSDFSFTGILRVTKNTYLNSNVLVGGNLTLFGKKAQIRAPSIIVDGEGRVATESWVNKQLKNYASSKHTHTVSIGHMHSVVVSGSTYYTSGVSKPSRTTSQPG